MDKGELRECESPHCGVCKWFERCWEDGECQCPDRYGDCTCTDEGKVCGFFEPTETGAERFYECVSKFGGGGNDCE